jgi:hypothetical protein
MRPKMKPLTLRGPKPFTLNDLREYLKTRPVWSHVYEVIDVIEAECRLDATLHNNVQLWLTYQEYSTIWLMREIMEPLREHPTLVEIGKRFNPTTEWHNTWMPLDTLIHNLTYGIG